MHFIDKTEGNRETTTFTTKKTNKLRVGNFFENI